MGLRFDSYRDLDAFLAGKATKRDRYGAIKTEDAAGLTHDSKAQADYASELRARKLAGEIDELTFEKPRLRYEITVNGLVVYTYTADARYRDLVTRRTHLVDVKSEATRKRRYWQIVKRLMLAVYGIEIDEVVR